MAFTAGDFDAYNLLDIQDQVDDMWRANHLYDAYKKPVNLFSEITSRQRLRLDSRFLDPSDCKDIKAAFLSSDCDFDINECNTEPNATGCDYDGDEAGAEELTYSHDPCFESKPYKVLETSCKNRVDFNTKVAHLMLQQLAQLDYGLYKKQLGAINSYAEDLNCGGSDIAAKYGVGALDGTGFIWEIPAANWDESLVAKMKMLQQDGMWHDPMLVTGNIWREDRIIYEGRETPNAFADSKGIVFSQPWIKNDPFFFDSVYTGATNAMLFDASQLAYYNTYRHMSPTPQTQPDQSGRYKWSVISPRHTWRAITENGEVTVPVRYDFYGQWKCGDRDNNVFVFFGVHNGGFLKGPDRLCATNCEKSFIKLAQT